MTKSAFLYASSLSNVALKLRSSRLRKDSISLSMIGDFLSFSICTLSGTMSNAITSLCWANNKALESPTYPVPATATFSILTV